MKRQGDRGREKMREKWRETDKESGEKKEETERERERERERDNAIMIMRHLYSALLHFKCFKALVLHYFRKLYIEHRTEMSTRRL